MTSMERVQASKMPFCRKFALKNALRPPMSRICPGYRKNMSPMVTYFLVPDGDSCNIPNKNQNFLETFLVSLTFWVTKKSTRNLCGTHSCAMDKIV